MPTTSRGSRLFRTSPVRSSLTVRASISTVPGTEATALLGTGAIAPVKVACSHCATELDVAIGAHTVFPTHFQCPDCGAVMESL
ncbi:MAG: hypothetical protein NVSMB19_18570 [Vulcanimicrobiaceae bacterium]